MSEMLGKTLLSQEQRITEHCDKLAVSGTEHAHQRAFFGWLAWMKQLGVYPRADRMFAIPNGGKRDPITAARLKAEGVKPGVPDTFYPIPRESYPNGLRVMFAGLFLEFKKPKKGRESESQSDWIEQACRDGFACATVYSWRGAVAAFIAYNTGREVERTYQ